MKISQKQIMLCLLLVEIWFHGYKDKDKDGTDLK